MHYLQLFFLDRAEPILVPVTEEEGRSTLDQFRDRTEALGFFEFGSVVEHHIWLNGTRLQMTRFLLEMDRPPFEPGAISPSKQFPANADQEPDFDVQWQVTFWLRGRRAPVVVSDLVGHDWVEVCTSCDCDEEFLVVTDEDGEELVLRIAEIDMISALELLRYSDTQLETIAGLIKYAGD